MSIVKMETAYFVGGPADGQECDVALGLPYLHWAEMTAPRTSWFSDPVWKAEPAEAPSMRVHEYRPCPETGEWLWSGVRP